MKKTSELKEALKKGDYKDLLSDIYVDESKRSCFSFPL